MKRDNSLDICEWEVEYENVSDVNGKRTSPVNEVYADSECPAEAFEC